MYIYNVAVHIKQSIHQDWLDWIKPHIKEVLATGCFTKAKLTKVLSSTQNGEITYVIQYEFNSFEDLERYYNEYAEALRKNGVGNFMGKMNIDRTEFEIIEEFN